MPEYFAYGSDLGTERMVACCPGAAGPRPAVLADHEWLIGPSGTATVEAFPGSEVHGVVWRVTDDDLAALDVRPLTVRTADGPVTAWARVGHRVAPARPRPGYLEQVLVAAAHHGLPERWLDSLRRWDPTTWPARRSAVDPAGPRTLTELLADPDVHESCTLRSRFGFLAIHGGGLEVMTDVVAEAAADASGASVYVVRHPADYPHHLTSRAFRGEDSPALAGFLDHVEHAVSLHGYGRAGRSTHLLAGGRDRDLAAHLARHVAVPGYRVVTDLAQIPTELRGLHPDNPVNRVRRGGAQLELSARVRGASPLGGPLGEDGLTSATRALVSGLAAAARAWT